MSNTTVGIQDSGTLLSALAPKASPTFSGTVTMPDSGTYGSGGINGSIIGGTTAEAAHFTTLAASSTVSGTGFSTYLASPPAIGGSTAAAGSFTTLKGTTSLNVGGATIPSSTVAALLGQTYTYTTGNIGTYFTTAALNVGGGAFFSTDNNNQNIGLTITGTANASMGIGINAWAAGSVWTYINNSQGAGVLLFNAGSDQITLETTSVTGSVGGTISFLLDDQIGPAGWATSSVAAKGQDTINTNAYYVAGTAGASCSAGTVISGITVSHGIVTAITGTGC